MIWGRKCTAGFSTIFTLTHLCLVDSSTLSIRCIHLSFKGCLLYLILIDFTELAVSLKQIVVDPDQMPHYVASDLDLHCLPMSHLWDARLKWVKYSDTNSLSTVLDKPFLKKKNSFLFFHKSVCCGYSLEVYFSTETTKYVFVEI